MHNESGLERLLADESDLNRNMLSEVLAPFVKIGKESGTPIFTAKYSDLANDGKIIVYLLSKKAAVALGVTKEDEKATPKEISQATGVPYDSVKPTVSHLAREQILTREAGRYFFPNHLLLRAKELIE